MGTRDPQDEELSRLQAELDATERAGDRVALLALLSLLAIPGWIIGGEVGMGLVLAAVAALMILSSRRVRARRRRFEDAIRAHRGDPDSLPPPPSDVRPHVFPA